MMFLLWWLMGAFGFYLGVTNDSTYGKEWLKEDGTWIVMTLVAGVLGPFMLVWGVTRK